MFINNLRNLQNLHIYMYIYYLCIFFVIWLFKIDFQRYVYYTLTRKSVSRYERRMAETVWNEGTKKEEKENESEDFRWWEERERGRREQRKGSVARRGRGRLLWQSEAIRAAEKERERGFHKPGYASILHRKPTPTFTLAARPDDSMLKDGRLAG